MDEDWSAPLLRDDCLFSADAFTPDPFGAAPPFFDDDCPDSQFLGDDAFSPLLLDVSPLGDPPCFPLKRELSADDSICGFGAVAPPSLVKSEPLSDSSSIDDDGERWSASPHGASAGVQRQLSVSKNGAAGRPVGSLAPSGFTLNKSSRPPLNLRTAPLALPSLVRKGPNALSSSRPARLLIAAASSDASRRAIDVDYPDVTPSPPSSERASPNGDAASFAARHRSKMHELAVKHRLITEQDSKGFGLCQLSAEERRTLLQEGYAVPSRLPLSKTDEEALKVVRRKIKNKLSAQESRRKRKEYMETLENRVQNFHTENSSLRQRVRQLEQSNRSLVSQLRKLQTLVGGAVPNVAAPSQTTVCLTAFLLLFAIAVPMFPLWSPPGDGAGFDAPSFPGAASDAARYAVSMKSRVLLSLTDYCALPYSADFFKQSCGAADDDVRAAQDDLFYSADAAAAALLLDGGNASAPLVCVSCVAAF